MENKTDKRVVVIFNELEAGPYFLNPGESIPAAWMVRYSIKEIRDV